MRTTTSIFCFAALLALSSGAFGADVRVQFKPFPVSAGEPAQMTLSSGGDACTLEKYPEIKGIKWLGQPGSSVSIINGRKSVSVTYAFIAEKAGDYEFAPMVVVGDGKKKLTEKTMLKVVAGAAVDMDKHFFAEAAFIGDKRGPFYVGEEITLEVAILKAPGVQAAPQAYPALKVDDVVFDDFSKYNRDNDRFLPYEGNNPQIVKIGGQEFEKTRFITSFRPLAPGRVSGSATVECFFVPPRSRQPQSRQRSPFDDFFGESMFSDPFDQRRVPKTLTCKLPTADVLPLPPPPADSKFIGLVGDWKVQISLSEESLRAGEPVTLTIAVDGAGSLENMKPPQLDPQGFHVYPPETVRGKGGQTVAGLRDNAAVNYVLIPSAQGKSELSLSVCVFDTTKGVYVSTSFKKQFDIAPSKSPNGQVFIPQSLEKPAAAAAKVEPVRKVAEDLMYLKKTGSGAVLAPLWRNHFTTFAALLVFGPLFWAGVELAARRRRIFAGNPSLRRKADAEYRLGAVLDRVRKASDHELPAIVQSDVLPLINDIKGYPAGTTAGEIAARLDDKELSESIRAAEALAYAPSGHSATSELKERLLRRLKKLSVWVFAFLWAAVAASAEKPVEPASLSIQDAFSAYHDGDFKLAAKIFKSRIIPDAPDPAWVYNLGDCLYQSGDLAGAMVCFEQALRLSPRDSDILENLNLVRRKLMLPELYQRGHPLDLLVSARDFLRPDEWALACAVCWLGLWLALAARRFLPSRPCLAFMAVAAVSAGVCGMAWLSQKTTVYNPDRAVVVLRNAAVHTLPSEKSAKASFAASLGETVSVAEREKDWSLIRSGKAEGWVKSDSIAQILP